MRRLKIALLIAAISLSTGTVLYSQDAAVTIKTPLETVVPDTYILEEYWYYWPLMDADSLLTLDTLLAEEYNLSMDKILLTHSRTYNCHALAWYMWDGGITCWIGVSEDDAENVFMDKELGGDDSFVRVKKNESIANITCGDADVVSYWEGNHSARTMPNGGELTSKWGGTALVLHYWNNVPAGYFSTNYYFFRRNPNVAGETTGFTVIDGTASWFVTSLFRTDYMVLEGLDAVSGSWEELPAEIPKRLGRIFVDVGTGQYNDYRLVEYEESGTRRIVDITNAIDSGAAAPAKIEKSNEQRYMKRELISQLEVLKNRANETDVFGAARAAQYGTRFVIYTSAVLEAAVAISIADFWTSCGYDVAIKLVDDMPTAPDEFRSSLRASIADEAENGTMYFLLVGDANDHVEFSQQWPGDWEQYRQDLINQPEYPFPSGGQPANDVIKTFSIPDPRPRGASMSWFVPYWFTDLPYGDLDDDGIPDVVVSRLPFSSDVDVYAYGNKLWNGVTWDSDDVAFFVGDRNYHTDDDQIRITGEVGEIAQNIPVTASTEYLYRSSMHEQNAADIIGDFIDAEEPDLLLLYSTVSNRYVTGDMMKKTLLDYPWNMDKITTSHLFFVLGASCGTADFAFTEDPQYGLPVFHEFLAEPNKGAIAWIGPTMGSYQSGNKTVVEYILQELYAAPSRPAGESFMRAIQQILTEYDPDSQIAMVAKSYVYLGDPMIPFNAIIDLHQVLEVAPDGSRDFTTIQDAVNNAEPGDTVLVYAGTYNESVTISSGITVKGAEPGVTITYSSSAHTVNFVDLNSPTTFDGITVTRGGIGSYVGIYIDNSSPVIKNCDIEGVTGNVGGGVRVCGDSHPQFHYCDIIGNEATDGGGIVIRGTGESKPTASFNTCSFENNQASTGNGGAVWFQYDTAPDTAMISTSFFRCDFIENEAQNDGSAVWITNCTNAVFRECLFATNNLTGDWSGSVIGGALSGGEFIECTWVSNGKSGLGSWYVLGLPGFSGDPQSVVVGNCLFALNSDAIAIRTAYQDRYDVTYSDFFGNKSGDDYWLTHGIGNINEDPAFCDPGSGVFTLYSFSPCSEYVSGSGRIGARGIGCVPEATLSLDPDSLMGGGGSVDSILVACPSGDYGVYKVRVQFNPGEITRTIESEELSLTIGMGDTISVFDDDGVINADSAADADNGYTTTLSHRYFGGHGYDPNTTVFLNETPLERPIMINLRSFDEAGGEDGGGDGVVNLVDMSEFSKTYTSPPHTYVERRDYNADGCVDLIDFGLFAGHYLHESPYSMIPKTSNDEVVSDIVNVRLEFSEEITGTDKREFRVDIFVEYLSPFKAMCISLKDENSRLDFKKWDVNESYTKPIMATTLIRNNIRQVFIGVIGSKINSGYSLHLGTAVFSVSGREDLTLTKEDFAIVVCDVLSSGGDIQIMRSVNADRSDEVSRVYRDCLSQNYPNPFNPATVIPFTISQDGYVELSIYNVSGQLVRQLVKEHKRSNLYKIAWDGTDDNGNAVATGVYFYRLKTAEYSSSKKLVLLK
jgi:hypothetical protein